MKTFKSVVALVLSPVAFSGCMLTLQDGASPAPQTQAQAQTPKKMKSALQSVCDVTRLRAREQILKRIEIEKLRTVALKVSHELSKDELSSLELLNPSAENSAQDLSLQAARERAELIAAIYNGAIRRSGTNLSSGETPIQPGLSYTVGIDPVTSGEDSYTSIVFGHYKPIDSQNVLFEQVALAPTPDQSRYYVELYQVGGLETRADENRPPVYTTLSLFDAVDAAVPSYCSQIESALNMKDFNTVPGI